MNLYLLLSKTDDECDSVLAELTRFSVRTAGCFAAYAAVTVDSVDEAREITERLAAVCPGALEVLMSVEPEVETQTRAMSASPGGCIDPETGQVRWDCLGSPRPSLGPKMEFFAAAELTVSRDGRELAHAEIAATGGVIGVARLLDPRRVLVEVGATDMELLLQALDSLAGLRSVARVRSAVAVRPLDVAVHAESQ